MNRSIVLNDIEPAALSLRAASGFAVNLDLTMSNQDGTTVDLSLLMPTLELEPRSGGSVQSYPGQLDLAGVGTARFAVPGGDYKDDNGYRLSLFGVVDGIPALLARGVAITTPSPVASIATIGGGTSVARGIFNLNVVRNDSYVWQFKLWGDTAKTIPSDLTGAVLAAQIRETIGGAVIATMACEIKDAVGGVVWMSLESTQTGTLPSAPSYWDLQIAYPDGEVKTPIGGRVTVVDDVTRP